MRVLLAVLLCLLSLTGCGEKSVSSPLLGYWLTESGLTLNFVDDDTVYMGAYNLEWIEHDKYSYEVVEDYITLTLDSSPSSNPYSVVYNFMVDDGILTLYNDSSSVSYYGDGYMQEEIMVGLHVMSGGNMN